MASTNVRIILDFEDTEEIGFTVELDVYEAISIRDKLTVVLDGLTK